jgi:hypothetical protein
VSLNILLTFIILSNLLSSFQQLLRRSNDHDEEISSKDNWWGTKKAPKSYAVLQKQKRFHHLSRIPYWKICYNWFQVSIELEKFDFQNWHTYCFLFTSQPQFPYPGGYINLTNKAYIDGKLVRTGELGYFGLKCGQFLSYFVSSRFCRMICSFSTRSFLYIRNLLKANKTKALISFKKHV